MTLPGKYALHFLAGSSWPSTVVSLNYLLHAAGLDRAPTSDAAPFGPDNAHFQHAIAVALPVAFGATNVASAAYFGARRTRTQFALTGAVFGLGLSAVGRFQFGLPRRWFGFTEANEDHAHLIAAALYAAIWAGVVCEVERFMIR